MTDSTAVVGAADSIVSWGILLASLAALIIAAIRIYRHRNDS